MIFRFLAAHRRIRRGTVAALLLGLGWGAVEGVIRSRWFAERVRAGVIRELEIASGGSASIKELRAGATRLSFELHDIEIRNRESGGLPAVLTVPRASARLGWWALLSGSRALERLSVRNPIVHVEIGLDGSTNVPVPKTAAGLLGLEIRHFELHGGSVIWNGRKHAFRFAANGLHVRREFDPILEEYQIEATLAEPRWEIAGHASPPANSASISAVMRGSEIILHQATLSSEAYSVEVRGIFGNLQQPRFAGDYAISGDIQALMASLSDNSPDFSGTLHSKGAVNWDSVGDGLRYEGTLSGDELRHSGLDASVSFESTLTGDSAGFDMQAVAGSVLGGKIGGKISVSGLAGDPAFSADGTISGIAIGTLVDAAGTGKVPWNSLLDFVIEASGSLKEGVEASAQFKAHPVADASSLPVEGAGSFRYASRRRSIRLSRLQLSTPNARISASGSVRLAGRGELQVEASMASLEAGRRILALVQPQVTLPSSTPDGRYSFHGTLSGRTDRAFDTILDGEFAIENFSFRNQRWERLSVTGQLGAEGLEVQHGRLVDRDGVLELQGTLPILADGTLQIQAQAIKIDASKLARASGLELPIEGSMSMALALSGTLNQPTARASIEVSAPTFFGEPFEQLSAEVLYGDTGFEVRDGTLKRGVSELRASASMNPASQEIKFEVESNRWPLDDFAWAKILAPDLTGTAAFRLRAAGQAPWRGRPLQALQLDGSWDIADLRQAELELGHWKGELHSEGGDPSVAFDWEGNAFGGRLGGRAMLVQSLRSDPLSYNGSFEFQDLGLQDLAELLRTPTGNIRGEIAGQAGFGGVAGVAETFELNGTIDSVSARLADNGQDPYRVSNVFPVRWAIKNDTLRLDSMHLTGPGSDFEIDGDVTLGTASGLDMELEGSVNLELLRDLVADIEPGGRADVRMRLQGGLDDPTLEGSIRFLDAALRTPGVRFGLNRIHGTINFQEGIGRIENLTAAYGGGTLRCDGTITEQDAELEYRLNIAAQDVRVDHPEGVSSMVDGQFTLAGVGTRSILSGRALISRMATRDKLSFAELFSSVERAEGWQTANPTLAGMQLNIDVGAVTQLPIETSLARNVEADLDINLVGTVANPSILGTVMIAQGEIRMLSTDYRINRGDIRFVNPTRAEPVLNVELETRIGGVDIALVLSGPASNLNLSYRSDPPLPFHELVNLVAVGKEPTVDPGIATRRRIAQQSLVQTGADNLLSQSLARPVSQRLQRFFGVSRLKVDPQIGGLEANPSARISTEQQIADDLTLIYSYDLSSAQQQAIRIEWNPNRKWSIIVTRDQNGLVGSDVLYKVRLP